MIISSHHFHLDPLRLLILVSCVLPSRQLLPDLGDVNLLLKHLLVHFLPHNVRKIHLLLSLVKLVQTLLLLTVNLKVLHLLQ